MARDRAACDKAIREAWKREKQLVLEGKGTRNWTEEQQIELIELGKVFDNDGIAFEGQHMKSVATYPEYQGSPDNIQLLSHEEHLAAHKGDFHNQTNWYYDPVTLEFNDFGDGPPIACEAVELTQPIATVSKSSVCKAPDKALEDKEGSNSSRVNFPEKSHIPDYSSQGKEGFRGWIEQQFEEVKRHPWRTLRNIGLIVVGAYGTVKGVKTLKKYVQSDQTYKDVSSQTRQQRIDYDQLRKMIEEVGGGVNESNRQQEVSSALTKQVLDAGTQAISGLSDYSILLAKGYNTGLSQETRQEILENVLAENGEQSIIRLLRFLINTRSGNKQGKYEKAIAVWKEDLDFILRNK